MRTEHGTLDLASPQKLGEVERQAFFLNFFLFFIVYSQINENVESLRYLLG